MIKHQNTSPTLGEAATHDFGIAVLSLYVHDDG